MMKKSKPLHSYSKTVRIRSQKLSKTLSRFLTPSLSIPISAFSVYLLLISYAPKFGYVEEHGINLHFSDEAGVAPLPSIRVPYHTTPPKSLQNYIRWHKHARACYVNESCGPYHPNTLIWTCPSARNKFCAGVGDRLRSIQFAFLLAIITRRLFFIDWPNDPFPFNEVITPAYIDWTLPELLNQPLNVSLVHNSWPYLTWYKCPTGYECLEHKSFLFHWNKVNTIPFTMNLHMDDFNKWMWRISSISISGSATPDSAIKLSENDLAMRNHKDLQSKNILAIIMQRFLLISLFRPSKAVQNRISDFLPPQFSVGYISIHTRTGLDTREYQNSRFSTDKNYSLILAKRLLKCAMVVKKRWHHNNILFASDAILVKTEILYLSSQYKINMAISSVPALHIGSKDGHPKGLSEKERRLSFINVYAEFFAIAGGGAVISNGSGFSRMAHIMGNSSMLYKIQSDDDLLICRLRQ